MSYLLDISMTGLNCGVWDITLRDDGLEYRLAQETCEWTQTHLGYEPHIVTTKKENGRQKSFMVFENASDAMLYRLSKTRWFADSYDAFTSS